MTLIAVGDLVHRRWFKSLREITIQMNLISRRVKQTMKYLPWIIKFWYFLQVLNWCYREPSFILFFKLSSVWDGCRLMMCLFSVGPFGDILMVRVKVLKKLKIRTDGDEIFQKKTDWWWKINRNQPWAIMPGYRIKTS